MNPQFSSCCWQHGNILPPLEQPSEPLYSLPYKDTERIYPSICSLIVQVGDNSKRTPEIRWKLEYDKCENKSRICVLTESTRTFPAVTQKLEGLRTGRTTEFSGVTIYC
jgi:hypothetical protein